MKKLVFFLSIVLSAVFSAIAQSPDPIMVGYTVTSGTAGVNNEENYDKLLDGRKDTKWCILDIGDCAYVEFHVVFPFIPTGYILTTANDTWEHFARNPKDWAIKAKMNQEDEWTTIASVTNDNVLKRENATDYEFEITNDQGYKYFRFEVTAVRDWKAFQLGELRLRGHNYENPAIVVVTDYNPKAGTEGASSNENYQKLVDDDPNTKWCVNSLTDTTFIEFHHGSPFIPTGYILTTGNDNASNHGRNPKDWVIKAKLNQEDEWTTIATVTNDNVLQDVNNTDFEFGIDNDAKYKYFRFEILAVQNGSKFQLSEFKFKGRSVLNTDPVIAGFTAIDGASISNNYQNLLDNNRGNYWDCRNRNHYYYVDFYSDQAIIPTAYIITTVKSFDGFWGCNPKAWSIEAKMNFEDEWKCITQASDLIPNETGTDFEFGINNDKAYRYFRFAVSGVNYENMEVLRIAELRLRGHVVDDYTYFVKDVMLIGGSETEVNDLKMSYRKQGWKSYDYDLNKGCGSSSDWIYLLYKDEYNPSLENIGYITDFYLWTQNSSATETRTYDGRTYHLVPYDGGDHFKNVKGDLNSHAGGSDIHLYYTKEGFIDRRSVDNIYFNSTKNGALGSGGGTSGYDLNSGAGGDYIYMHFTTSQTIGVMPVGILNESVVGYGSINISGTAYDSDDLSASVPLHACLYKEDGVTLYIQKDFLADLPNNGFTKNLIGVLPGTYKLKMIATDINGNGDIQIGSTQTITVTEGPEIIEVGHGDSGSSHPLSSFAYHMNQQIYRAGGLQSAGTISGIAFYYYSYPNLAPFVIKDVQIYMQHTDKEIFESNQDVIPINLNQKVFEGTVIAENEGWLVFSFDTPFEYDGIHNLLISFNNPSSDNVFGNGYFFRVHDEAFMGIEYFSRTNPIDLENLAEYPSDSKFCFDYQNDIQFYVKPSGYPKPANLRLSLCTTDRVEITWDTPETDQSIYGYLYQFKRGDEPWIERVELGNSVSFENLVNDIDYRFRVKTLYSNDETSVFSEISFRLPTELPFENSFEEGYNGMTVFGIDWGHEGIKESYSYAGNKSFHFEEAEPSSPHYLISPCFPNDDEITVSFYYMGPFDLNEKIIMGYSTSDNGVDSFTWTDEIDTHTEYWTYYTNTFPVGTRYIAIKYVTYGVVGTYIDDIRFEKSSTHEMPTNLTASNITSNSATVTWMAPQGETPIGYGYQIMKTSDATWSADMGVVEENMVPLAHLLPDTEYDIRVKALYDNGESSYFARYRFITGTDHVFLPIYEDFENAMIGWRVVDGRQQTDVIYSTNSHGGYYTFYFADGESEPQYLISPEFISFEDVYLSFFYRSYIVDHNMYLLSYFYVGYSTSTNGLDSFTWSEELTSKGDWEEYTAIFPQDTKFIAIKWKSLGPLYIDDISIWTTMSHPVAKATNWNDPSHPIDGWNFIASPVNGNVAPTSVNGLIFSINDIPYVNSDEYDLYRLNNTTWENFKAHQNGFVFENGKGYLYATAVNTTIKFIGSTYEGDTKTVNISQGNNLVGNPFFADAYIDRPYYKMNAAGTDIEAVTDYINNPIPKFTGVVVTADGNETVTFSKEQPATTAYNNGSIQMTLMKANVRGDAVQDKAIVSFNEDTKLEKFIFNDDHAKLYIPQSGEDYAIAFSNRHGEIPLHFKANEPGRYTIAFEGDMRGATLIDKIEDTTIDLGANDSYTFVGSPADKKDRFVIAFASASDTFAYQDGNDIIVTGEGELQVFDIIGRMVMTQHVNGIQSINTMQQGIYVFKLNGMTQKMVVR